MDVGVDCGGTFTDLVGDDGSVRKVPSVPEDPARAVADSLARLAQPDGGAPQRLAHGTTVATNAVLERAGAAVALYTTAGFEDVIEIARQTRPSLYDHLADRPEPLVPRERRVGVVERLDAAGSVVTPLDVAGLAAPPPGTEAIAVCLLHADLDPSHEQEVAVALRAGGWDVVCSHEVAPEFREYERCSTTVADSYLRPRCRSYVANLAAMADDVAVMTSAGGLIDVDSAASHPARLLLSGPAGGVRAAAAFAEVCGYADAVSFDMGGTSTDVCLIQGGLPAPAAQRDIGGLPVRLPSLDIHTIGAGGGSIARIDTGGALTVGPESAGAAPGPACYGHGGTRPTVTDADVAAGHISEGTTMGGLVIDGGLAHRALDEAGVEAQGVIDVVNANMARALRTVTVERGVDPRDCALVAFGGAGPVHAAALADVLAMPAVVVPPRAGVLSAVGLLCAPRQRDLVRTWPRPADHHGALAAAAALGEQASDMLRGAGNGVEVEVEVETFVDCRYAGQSHEITVVLPSDFGAEHERRNGYRRDDSPVEVVAIRALARLRPRLDVVDLEVPEHRAGFEAVVGPATVADPECTVVVPAGWRADRGPAGCLVLTRAAGSAGGRR
ncbi:MAG TPA: hydantoinase/oxoprolinase family protein [Acidimicrobiales bacterium]